MGPVSHWSELTILPASVLASGVLATRVGTECAAGVSETCSLQRPINSVTLSSNAVTEQRHVRHHVSCACCILPKVRTEGLAGVRVDGTMPLRALGLAKWPVLALPM